MPDLTDEDRAKHYETCLVRGHVPDGHTLASNPPWQHCRYCGKYYRYETKVIEYSTDKGEYKTTAR